MNKRFLKDLYAKTSPIPAEFSAKFKGRRKIIMTNFIAIASIVAMLTSGGGNIQTTGLITENNISSIIQSMENSDYYALTAKVVDVNHKENLVSAELVNRIYDEENDIMVCELKAVNGEFYTLYDFTAAIRKRSYADS